MKILVTGSAGFIGFHLVKKLISLGHTVIGIDNINDYYDINLKYDRLLHSGIQQNLIQYGTKVKSVSLAEYYFIKLDLTDYEGMLKLFSEEQFDSVCNLAAQAGVRYSIENPHSYIESNIKGFLNILELSKIHLIKHLVYASSSSVYGLNENLPFSVTDPVDRPISLYAATKRSNELMAHTYSYLYNIPITGLRFFTVYGSWGRPDMSYFKFADLIYNNKPIEIYNNGNMKRDFTFINDIINGIVLAINNIPINLPCPFVIFNLGNNKPEKLLDFINILENELGKKAKKIYLELQPGDVPVTMANIDYTKKMLKWEPETSIKDGLKSFVEWFLEYKKK